MKALVLTYDKYHIFTHHMINEYEAIWSDHPFRFIVPYNNTTPEYLRDRPSVLLKKTDAQIKACALQMLDGIGDDEWVYWCIDDKYPIHLVTDAFRAAVEFVENCTDPSISGLCLSRSRGLMVNSLIDQQETLEVSPKIKAIKRLRYNQIWYHQFLRAKVLRHMFQSFPDHHFNAKQMDYYIDDLEMPADHQLYVTQHNYTTYGETTDAGKITANCAKSLIDHGHTIPDGFDVLEEEIIMGENPFLFKNRLRRSSAGEWATRMLRTG